MVGEDLSVRVDIIRQHQLFVLDVALIAHLIQILLWVAGAAEVPGVLFSYLEFNPIVCVLIAVIFLVLDIELPDGILIVLSLVLGGWYFSSF